MAVDYQWEQASVKHLYSAQNGEPMRARFRDSITEPWQDGWLVGWVKGDHQWMVVASDPDDYDFYSDALDGDPSYGLFRYCEVTTKNNEVKNGDV
jgi:hypothetical protein